MKNLIEKNKYINGNINDLIEKPVVIKICDIDETSAREFSNNISKAHNTGQKVIPVIIDSYGGDVYSLLTMISEIENSSLPIATITTGKAMSCGAVLLACGTPGYRYADNNTAIMLHDISASFHGKNDEIMASADEISRVQNQIFSMLNKKCNQKKGYFEKLLHENSHADWYLTHKMAIKHKIIDYIKIPVMKTIIELKFDFK